jgi:hypothetical protein
MDALNILRYIAGMADLTDEQWDLYDLVPWHGNITVSDALEILKHLARMPNVIGILPLPPDRRIVELVNIERAKAGLPPLAATNSNLNRAANRRAADILERYRPPHYRPDGTSWSTVLTEYNVLFRSAAENLAAGQRTPEEVVKAWMDSPGHRDNIMSRNFTHIGVGVEMRERDGRMYWVQLFIRV